MNEPIIISRQQHHLSRKLIDKKALKVLYHLHNNGYDAYLVGGCVRDLLLGQHPKDYDVVTNATPDEIKKLFSNCRLIGRRFRLAHIYFGRYIIEVATFRAHHTADSDASFGLLKNGLIVRDNIFGNIEEDAWRRDFTINALYYNIADFSIVDYTGGLEDIEKRQLRMIGDPKTRYREDPVRMLRAIRFASKLNFDIATDTAKPIKEAVDWLEEVSPSRLFDEVIKIFHCGHAQMVFKLLKQYKLFDFLFPATHELLSKNNTDEFLAAACSDTDKRIAIGKHISVVYLFAFLLWPAVIRLKRELLKEEGRHEVQALIDASFQVISDQCCITSIPRRITNAIHEIWRLQYRLELHRRRSAYRCLENPRFRAAYDLLQLRSRFDKSLVSAVNWWKKFMDDNPVESH